MNKSRRLVTETSIGLADAGCASLSIDLLGTGDSSGGFADATWSAWRANVCAAIDWTAATGLTLHGVIATRLGAALAAEALLEAGATVSRTVFWQPVTSGRQFMTQFLRLRSMASMMDGGPEETVEGIRQRLESGDTVEIAGYELTPALWADIEGVELIRSTGSQLGSLKLLEVGRSKDSGLSVAGRRFESGVRDLGVTATGERVPGDPFWSATEIVTNNALSEISIRFLTEGI